MHIEEYIARTRAACEAEAVAHGLPPEAGADIYDACVADDLDGWDEQTFLNWTQWLERKYPQPAGSRLLNEAYLAICNVMGSYGQMGEQVTS